MPRAEIFVTEGSNWTRITYSICPGRHLADTTVWLAIARMLATFDFCKPVDDNGQAYDQHPEFETSITW